MRIKKVSQTTPVQAHLTNAYSESTQDGYSADYINNNFGIIEEGSNANGSYIKYGNGIVIQWVKHVKKLIADVPSLYFSHTYPVPMNLVLYVQATNIYYNSYKIVYDVINASDNSKANIYPINLETGQKPTIDFMYDLFVIGKWK